jgi:RNA polymerase sigma-70 factor (ECF subfamily)
MLDVGSLSDAALVVAIGRYREDALAEIHRRHGGAVHRLARRVVGADALADEVVQEVFVDLWRRPESFDPERGSLRTFLVAKAHHRAVDVVRSEASRRAREEREARQAPVVSDDIERHAWRWAMAEELNAAVAALPREERRAIEMAYLDGHTYREVARLLDQPEGTVKSRIRNGLRHLREALVAIGVETAWPET